MNYILCYGTLRRGCTLFNRFGWQTFIKTIKLPGFSMYSLGGCPAIVKDDSKNEIVAELHSIDDKTAERIRDLELNAGYDEALIEIDFSINGKELIHVKPSIYVYDQKWVRNLHRIENGDWKEYSEKRYLVK